MRETDRSKACCNGLFRIVLASVLLGVIFGLTKKYELQGKECAPKMVTWLYVYGGTHGYDIILGLI